MKKIILTAVLLVSCLLLLSPAALAAAPEVHRHPRESFALPVTDAAQIASAGKDGAYLTADVTATADILISEETKLCLNGHKLDMGEYSIQIGASATFSLYDCPESTGGRILSAASSDKPVIHNTGIFNMFSGTVSTETRTALLNVNMCSTGGGLITGTAPELVQTIGSAVFNMNGGEIRALDKAVGLAMIEDEQDASAKKRDYNVGIIGKISAQAGSEGAVVVKAPYGRLVLNTGADIRGRGCPGIKVLSGNFDTYGGALVSSDSESAIVGIGGNVSLYNSTINSTEKYGVDISDEAKLLLSGAQDINGGLAGVHLSDGKLFSMSDYGFYGDVRVSVYIDNAPDAPGESVAISNKCEQKHTVHFLSANPRCSIVYEDGAIHCTYDEAVSHYHETQNYVLPLDSSYSDLNKNNFYLVNDISMNGVYIGKTVNICLNGHTLNLANAIKLYPGSTLNIHDCVGGGKIVSNSCCVQFIDGSASLVLNGGTIQSNAGGAIRLTHGSSIILRGGEIVSAAEGTSAVEVSGLGGNIDGSAGSIKGGACAVKVQDSSLSLNGNVTLSGGSYAIEYPGQAPGMLTLGGSSVLEGGSADILLGSATVLELKDSFSPAESYTLSRSGGPADISLPAAYDFSKYFVSTQEGKLIFNSDGNILRLVSTVPVSPAEADCYPGETVNFTVSHDSADAAYQWYVRSAGSGVSESVDGAVSAVFEKAAIESGEYDVYCRISDSSGEYIGSALLKVKKDEIKDVSVSLGEELSINGDSVIPNIIAVGTTAMGKDVSFSYSLDAVSYSSSIPTLNTDGGETKIYYKASADGCEDITGEISVNIPEQDMDKQPEVVGEQSQRKITILILVFIFFVLCVLYVLRFTLRKIRE